MSAKPLLPTPHNAPAARTISERVSAPGRCQPTAAGPSSPAVPSLPQLRPQQEPSHAPARAGRTARPPQFWHPPVAQHNAADVDVTGTGHCHQRLELPRSAGFTHSNRQAISELAACLEIYLRRMWRWQADNVATARLAGTFWPLSAMCALREPATSASASATSPSPSCSPRMVRKSRPAAWPYRSTRRHALIVRHRRLEATTGLSARVQVPDVN